ncbi:MAG TPA: hypothetical protein VHL80_13010, partial [Polyangia bacterium]|nr:hypothetical protein [Polyangia bacterium]
GSAAGGTAAAGSSAAGAAAGSSAAGSSVAGSSTAGSSAAGSSAAGSSAAGSSAAGSSAAGSSAAGSSAGGSSAAGAAGGSVGTGAACTKAKAACTASNTGCNVSSYYFYDNQWNCGPQSGNHCGAESGYACANADQSVSFVVTSNEPAKNTAVLTYPAVQKNFTGKPPLASFKSITSTFSETSPHVGDYEVAWDCWFNGLANEVMVWVDNYNQVPAGKKVASNVTLSGHGWDVWYVASSGYLAFNATSTITSGTIDLLALFKYAASNGWLPADATVSQLAFGIEVCSTDGKDATFTVDDYSLTAN